MTKLNYAQEIIDYCKKNRISSTQVADALGKTGVLPNIKPLNLDHHKVGLVRCIFTAFDSNYQLHDEIQEIKEDEIALIFCHELKDQAVLGELISKYCLYYKGAAAIVVQGLVRDIDRIRKDKYPIWSEDFTALGCSNKFIKAYPSARKKNMKMKFDGSIAICDGGGVCIIPNTHLDANMLHKLKLIELQEDVWAYCLNTLKWTTKEIICDKKYLKKETILSKDKIDELLKLNKLLKD
jgi:regulator of RNase E activity RraA